MLLCWGDSLACWSFLVLLIMASWKSQDREPERIPEWAEAEHERCPLTAVADGTVGSAAHSSWLLSGDTVSLKSKQDFINQIQSSS